MTLNPIWCLDTNWGLSYASLVGVTMLLENLAAPDPPQGESESER